jgi:hypothetical protein
VTFDHSAKHGAVSRIGQLERGESDAARGGSHGFGEAIAVTALNGFAKGLTHPADC